MNFGGYYLTQYFHTDGKKKNLPVFTTQFSQPAMEWLGTVNVSLVISRLPTKYLPSYIYQPKIFSLTFYPCTKLL